MVCDTCSQVWEDRPPWVDRPLGMLILTASSALSLWLLHWWVSELQDIASHPWVSPPGSPCSEAKLNPDGFLALAYYYGTVPTYVVLAEWCFLTVISLVELCAPGKLFGQLPIYFAILVPSMVFYIVWMIVSWYNATNYYITATGCPTNLWKRRTTECDLACPELWWEFRLYSGWKTKRSNMGQLLGLLVGPTWWWLFFFSEPEHVRRRRGERRQQRQQQRQQREQQERRERRELLDSESDSE